MERVVEEGGVGDEVDECYALFPSNISCDISYKHKRGRRGKFMRGTGDLRNTKSNSCAQNPLCPTSIANTVRFPVPLQSVSQEAFP